MHAFSPKNAIFCTFLQGGGTTFWQAQKRGFSGPGGRASGPAQDPFFASKKSPNVSSTAASQHSKEKCDRACMLRMQRDPRLVKRGTLQQSGLADRPEAIIIINLLIVIFHIFLILLIPRSVDHKNVTTIALSFVRSMSL
jgi:hypothetical protein